MVGMNNMKIVFSLIAFIIISGVIYFLWEREKFVREGFVPNGRGMDIEVDYSQSDVDYSGYTPQ